MAQDDFNRTILKNPPGYRAPDEAGWRQPKFLVYPAGLGDISDGTIPHTPYVQFGLLDREAFLGGMGGDLIPSRITAPRFTVVGTRPQVPFSITLPLPTSGLRTSYKIDYEAIDLGEVALADRIILRGWQVLSAASPGKLANPTAMGKFLSDILPDLSSPEASAALTNAAYGLSSLAGPHGDAMKGVIRQGEKFAWNPFTEQLFKTVQFRVHDFEFVFLPKSPADSDTIYQIISLFQWYMHPYKDGDADFRLAAPNEFTISYSVQDTTFGLLPSVLESMDLDYGGSLDAPRFFIPNKNGKQYPTKITMNLRFKETVILTRNTLAPEMTVVRQATLPEIGDQLRSWVAENTPTRTKKKSTYNMWGYDGGY